MKGEGIRIEQRETMSCNVITVGIWGNADIGIAFHSCSPWSKGALSLIPLPPPILPRSLSAQYATGDQWRNNSRKNEGMEPKQKQHPVVDVTGGRSKIQCCKKQYCIGTRNVRSMNQGKLEVVKQEMARVNVHILGISKLKWTGMGEFNSHDHYIYYCEQESLKRNGVAIMVNKRVRNAILGYSLKNDRMAFLSDILARRQWL